MEDCLTKRYIYEFNSELTARIYTRNNIVTCVTYCSHITSTTVYETRVYAGIRRVHACHRGDTHVVRVRGVDATFVST